MSSEQNSEKQPSPFFVGAAVGAVVGAAVGVALYKRFTNSSTTTTRFLEEEDEGLPRCVAAPSPLSGSTSLRHYTFPYRNRKVDSFESVSAGFREVQDYITSMLTKEGGVGPREDCWDYHKGEGGGRSRIWEGNNTGNILTSDLIERGGVNFSALHGNQLPKAATVKHGLPENTPFAATGVSLVIHPSNPHIATIHMNIRYLETGNGVWWFGGGIDVTPYYPLCHQIADFHQRLQTLCESHGQDYATYKAYCDKYFTLHHRQEMRGVGGIFFDNLSSAGGKTKQEIFEFCRDLGVLMVDYYSWMIQTNRDTPYSEEERDFQLLRRGRYAEFNLLWDRGTKFGIESKGRTESILMSLPAEARWRYDWKPKPGSREEFVCTHYLQPQEWTSVSGEKDLKLSVAEVVADPRKL